MNDKITCLVVGDRPICLRDVRSRVISAVNEAQMKLPDVLGRVIWDDARIEALMCTECEILLRFARANNLPLTLNLADQLRGHG